MVNVSQTQQDKLNRMMGTYGIAVRAGAITPQITDEIFVREKLGLPPMSDDVIRSWASTNNVRRPITLADAEESAEQDDNPNE